MKGKDMREIKKAVAVNVPAALIIAAMLLVGATVAALTGHPVFSFIDVALCCAVLIAVRHYRREDSAGKAS